MRLSQGVSRAPLLVEGATRQSSGLKFKVLNECILPILFVLYKACIIGITFGEAVSLVHAEKNSEFYQN